MGLNALASNSKRNNGDEDDRNTSPLQRCREIAGGLTRGISRDAGYPSHPLSASLPLSLNFPRIVSGSPDEHEFSDQTALIADALRHKISGNYCRLMITTSSTEGSKVDSLVKTRFEEVPAL